MSEDNVNNRYAIVSGCDAKGIPARLPSCLSEITLAWYVASMAMTREQQDEVKAAVANHRSILVAGSTASGKTTMVKALINEMTARWPEERMLAVVEDTGGLSERGLSKLVQCDDARIQRRAVRGGLRMALHSLVIDEVRTSPLARAVTSAWKTGHFTVASVHAADPRRALMRLQCLLPGELPDHDLMEINPLIVHVCVSRRRGGPNVRTVGAVVSAVAALSGD